MKKYGLKGILGLTAAAAALILLTLSIFTDWGDGVFLPAALGCVCVSSVLSFLMQLEARKKEKETEKNRDKGDSDGIHH